MKKPKKIKLVKVKFVPPPQAPTATMDFRGMVELENQSPTPRADLFNAVDSIQADCYAISTYADAVKASGRRANASLQQQNPWLPIRPPINLDGCQPWLDYRNLVGNLVGKTNEAARKDLEFQIARLRELLA